MCYQCEIPRVRYRIDTNIISHVYWCNISKYLKSTVLEIKDTTESIAFASYPDLLLSIGREGQLHISIYDKRDYFNFHITNFPFLSSNLSSPAYGVLSLSLYDTSGLAPCMNFLYRGPCDFPVSYSEISCGTLEITIREVLWSIRGSYSAIWSLPLTNIEWHWPLISYSGFQTDQTFNQFHDFDTELDLPKLRVVSMEHFANGVECQQGTLTLPDTWFCVPFFGTCLCSDCWDHFSRTCRVFPRLFTLEYPSYFLDFSSILGNCQTDIVNGTIPGDSLRRRRLFFFLQKPKHGLYVLPAVISVYQGPNFRIYQQRKKIFRDSYNM